MDSIEKFCLWKSCMDRSKNSYASFFRNVSRVSFRNFSLNRFRYSCRKHFLNFFFKKHVFSKNSSSDSLEQCCNSNNRTISSQNHKLWIPSKISLYYASHNFSMAPFTKYPRIASETHAEISHLISLENFP